MRFLDKFRFRHRVHARTGDVGLDYFRERLLYYLLLFTFALGLIVYVPCIYFSFKFDLPAIAILDTIVMGLFSYLFFSRRLVFSTRAIGVLSVFYLLGTGLLIGVGPMGAGFLWLVMFSAMTGVLMGTKPVYYSLAINTFTCLFLGILVYLKKLPWINSSYDAFALWLIIGINFLCIIAIISISVSILLTKISLLLEKEKNHAAVLEKEIQMRIHAQKENERLAGQLLHAKKMEALGTLAGGVAHDFNNVLSAILGYTELSMLDLEEDDPLYDNLNNICLASDRAKGIVHQILTFSRQTDSKKKVWQAASIVDESCRLFQISIPSHITFNKTINTDYNKMLKADRTQIYQVIMNLCTNAVQAIGKSPGNISVTLNIVSIDSTHDLVSVLDPGNYFKISITDTGCGIETEKISKIFDPYYTTKAVGEGSGMGLAIAHGIIKNHGGEIIVSSKPDQGSIFYLYLPVVDETSIQSEKNETISVKGNETILFVDDEPQLLSIGKQYLERMGYSVTAKSNPITALEMFKRQPDRFQLVITDRKMPEMPGNKLKDEILKVRPGLPVILCSGFAEDADTTGFTSVLVKPVNAEVLGKCVRSALDEKR